jgi:hypothetical protein
MKQTKVKMHLYFQGVELSESDVDTLLKIITTKATEAGIPMSFQIHEVEIINNG